MQRTNVSPMPAPHRRRQLNAAELGESHNAVHFCSVDLQAVTIPAERTEKKTNTQCGRMKRHRGISLTERVSSRPRRTASEQTKEGHVQTRPAARVTAAVFAWQWREQQSCRASSTIRGGEKRTRAREYSRIGAKKRSAWFFNPTVVRRTASAQASSGRPLPLRRS